MNEDGRAVKGWREAENEGDKKMVCVCDVFVELDKSEGRLLTFFF